MVKIENKAFTLVELIVVIIILAILGTIAFISLQGYSRDARDSVRISDLSKIKTSLELFQLNAGKYPNTSGESIISYSGITAWYQGVFGDTTFNSVDKLDRIPTDPQNGKKYTYSVTGTKQEYQLVGIMEGGGIVGINNVNAATKTATAKVTGNYNGKLLKVIDGIDTYILALPSILTADGLDVENIAANNSFVYNGYENLPLSYSGTSYEVLGDSSIKLVNENEILLYSGATSLLSEASDEGKSARKTLIEKMQLAYTGTALENVGEIVEILSVTTDEQKDSLASTIVSNNLGGSIISGNSSTNNEVITSSCDTIPSFPNIGTITTGEPNIIGKAWEYKETPGDCTYTCDTGFFGTNCSNVIATGGNSVYTTGGYKIHVFNNNGTLNVNKTVNMEVLVVAGGGGTGYSLYHNGGGGGGGVVYHNSKSTSTGSISVTVGNGGTGGTATYSHGISGGNSVFFDIIAVGGGYGGSRDSVPGANGGNGGGGAENGTNPSHVPGVGNQGDSGGGTGYGNSGGYGFAGGKGAGGGGGAGQVGGEGVYNVRGGNGGNGIAFPISGINTYYGGGGGGATYYGNTTSAGGLGGGGIGHGIFTNGVANSGNGIPNTGGGAGGYERSDERVGAIGGSGIVIVRYPSNELIPIGTTEGSAGKSCENIKLINPSSVDGTYWILADGINASEIYCNMSN